ncbi:MAG: hypothetical protein BWY31_01496 [Lentisphaerae bacterium ADurb.Bin242]|nr:MAG: hypothetical protein BWY31_01496 [Lentisphaerae bacterium ADurb.Bin242]
MKLTPEILNALRLAIEHYGNTSQFAKHVGIAHSTVLFWLSGKTSNISGHIWVAKIRRELKNFMNEPEDRHFGYMLREDQEPYRRKMPELESKRAPLVTFTEILGFDSTLESASAFAKRLGDRVAFFANPVKDSYFALKVDSSDLCPMFPIGTVMLVAGGEYAQDGDIVVGKLRNPATVILCKYTRNEETIQLTPLNGKKKAFQWNNKDNAENLVWLYPVLEININLLNRKWENGELVEK